jgi:hypothetical protein
MEAFPLPPEEVSGGGAPTAGMEAFPLPPEDEVIGGGGPTVGMEAFPLPPEDDVASARALRADVIVPDWEGADVPVARSFVAGRRHRVEIWIGHQRDARDRTIHADAPFVESAVEVEGNLTELDVTLIHGQRSTTETLFLPRDQSRSSKPCKFDLEVEADESVVSATLIVSQHNRVLQQAVVKGRVTATPDEAPDGEIELETQVLARSVETPGPKGAIDATVVHPADAPAAVLAGGEATIVAPWDERVRATLDIVAERLFNSARALAADETDEGAWHALVRLLAAQGTDLHLWLRTNGYTALDAAERIQVTAADPTKPLPLELVYDRGAIADDATPCAGWDEALATGTCPSCQAPVPGTAAKSICPLGFWGLSKVIERQVGKTDGRPPGRLTPLTSVLFAASNEVLEKDYDETKAFLEKVLGRPPTAPDSWDAWPPAQASPQSLMVILPHQGYNDEQRRDYLEIGRSSKLVPGQLTQAMLRATAGGGQPIVLLLGCKTANASISYRNFVAEFRENGAAIVVGTLSTILGQNAAPIARGFVEEISKLNAGGAPGGTGFGDVMRTVRRRMVATRNAAAFGVVAFGDSDWILERSP